MASSTRNLNLTNYGSIHKEKSSCDNMTLANHKCTAHEMERKSFLEHMEDMEDMEDSYGKTNAQNYSHSKVQLALNLSLLANVVLAIAKLYAAIHSGSLAVLSSLVDSILDLTSQTIFWLTDKHMHTPSALYPAGRRRLEPVGVIISATLMGMAAVEVIQTSVETLVHGITGVFPSIDMSLLTIIILSTAIGIKLVLWRYCGSLADTSQNAAALAQDHRNDVFSNVVAIITSVVAHRYPHLWYLDPSGAIAISLYITLSWILTGKEQVERLVGIQADEDFISMVREMTDIHHPAMKADIVRAYHFGNYYLVEIEVILPGSMCVKDSHDISLSLQKKVESLQAVERAFVHVDYASRDYDEHKDTTVRRNSNDD